jgi:hypothetical protein
MAIAWMPRIGHAARWSSEWPGETGELTLENDGSWGIIVTLPGISLDDVSDDIALDELALLASGLAERCGLLSLGGEWRGSPGYPSTSMSMLIRDVAA